MNVVQETKDLVGDKLTSIILGIVAPPNLSKLLSDEQAGIESKYTRCQKYIAYEEVTKRSRRTTYPSVPSCCFLWALRKDPSWFFEIVGWPTTMKHLAKVARTIQRGTFRLEQVELRKVTTTLAQLREPAGRGISENEKLLRTHIANYDTYVAYLKETVRLLEEIDVSWVKPEWDNYLNELSYDRYYHYSDCAATYRAGKNAEARVKDRIDELKMENNDPMFLRFLSYF